MPKGRPNGQVYFTQEEVEILIKATKQYRLEEISGPGWTREMEPLSGAYAKLLRARKGYERLRASQND